MSTTTADAPVVEGVTVEATEPEPTPAPAKKSLKDRWLEQTLRERAIERIAAESKKHRAELEAEFIARYKDEGTTNIRLEHDGAKLAQPTISISQATAIVTDDVALAAWVSKHLGPDSIEFITRVRPGVVSALSKNPEKSEDGGVQWVDPQTGEAHTVPGMEYVAGGNVKGVSITTRDKDALDAILEAGDFPIALTPGKDA